jgi:menaquinone-dependent protoporphyrinogen oxidase
MTARILVAYATRKGSTAEIAQAVGKELQSAGHHVDVAEAKTVSTLAGYHAVVIGAPVYMGKLEKDISNFVTKNRDLLSHMPLAAFAVGIAPVAPQIQPVDKVLSELKKGLSPLQPVTLTVFAVMLDPEKMSFTERKLTGMMNIRTEDFRDWSAIAAWARDRPGKMGV